MKITKNIDTVIGCIVAIGCAALCSPSFSQTQHHTLGPRQTVALWAYQAGEQVNGHYQYYGAQVYASSSSEGAPAFPQADIPSAMKLTELGDAISQLLNAGFHIEKVSDNGQFYLLVK